MIVINKTISFAESVQTDGVLWIKNTYMPLMQACPLVKQVLFFKIDTQQGSDDCFAFQIMFDITNDYILYCQKYESDFDNALLLKFQNYIGIFKTILREI